MELTPKPKPEEAKPNATTGVTTEKPLEPAPERDDVVSHIVPLELASKGDAITIKVEGDFIEMQMSKAMVEHVAEFRSYHYVRFLFRNGTVPDITAYRDSDLDNPR